MVAREFGQVLDPFLLARYAKLLVVPYDQIEPLLTDETKKHLIGEGKDTWSGGAASQPLPDGRKLIILNPTHGKNRHRATLMEEVSHVFLGHKPSRLAIKRRDKKGNIVARDYNHDIEEEAGGQPADICEMPEETEEIAAPLSPQLTVGSLRDSTGLM
jgi:hypothetical protein